MHIAAKLDRKMIKTKGLPYSGQPVHTIDRQGQVADPAAVQARFNPIMTIMTGLFTVRKKIDAIAIPRCCSESLNLMFGFVKECQLAWGGVRIQLQIFTQLARLAGMT
jgi:hypothetical protein